MLEYVREGDTLVVTKLDRLCQHLTQPDEAQLLFSPPNPRPRKRK